MEGIQTARLILRPWREDDHAPFASLNADPAVMEFLPERWSKEQSDAAYDRIQKHWADHGFGIWAIEIEGKFAGTVGLRRVTFEAEFTPCVELGYRINTLWWGRGLMTEAAGAAVRYGFETVGLDEIVAFTIPPNVRSQRVMVKLGMTYAGEFDHPDHLDNDRFRRHVLYRLTKPPAG